MKARSPALFGRPERAVLLLGGLGALALLGVAFLDFGDPRAAARARLEGQVRALGVLVDQGWAGLREAAELPGEAVLFETLAAGTARPVDAAPGDEPGGLTGLLLASGEGAYRSGEFGSALRSAMDVLEGEPSPEAKARADHLALRAWAALGDLEMVRHHRGALLESEADPLWEGTSVKLLGLLVEPVDGTRALEGLRAGAFALPAPVDRVKIEPDGVTLISDPWWSALGQALEPSGSRGELDDAFRTSARLGAALAARLDAPALAREERWTFARAEAASFALRRQGDRIHLALVEPAALARSLGEGIPAQAWGGFELHAGEGAGELFAVHALEDAPFELAFAHPDPWADLRAELARRRLVRGALAVLGLAVAGAAFLAARSMARARRLEALRRTFVASVSHDLRTPTQAVLLLAETLEQGRVATPESRGRYVVGIRREAQRMRRLVEDLLDVARLERGDGARVERRPEPMEPFLDELETALTERAEEAGARLEVVRESLPERLEIDADGVHRTVWNLFENALHYGHAPGETSRVRVTFGGGDGELRVTVADEGPGIPARFAARVFEPYERLRDEGREGVQADTGTGLGLSIVRALTRAHGGDVVLEPGPGGATFRATFATDGEDVA